MEIISSLPDTGALKPTKRSRANSNNNSPNSKKSKVVALQLVDINNDCLEEIFMYLDLMGLVNIAECDERFTSAAQSVYLRRYCKMKAYLYFETIHHEPGKGEIRIHTNIAEALFRQFGHLISNLTVQWCNHYEGSIEKTLLSCRFDSLTVLRLIWLRSIDFQTLNKPFEKVEDLTIIQSFLSHELSRLNIWFPNLIRLKLYQVKFLQSETLKLKFPLLKHLEISNTLPTMSENLIIAILRINPQLESLTLRHNLDVKFLQSIAKCLPFVVKLELWEPMDGFKIFREQTISFENVKEFKLNARQGYDLNHMPFKFNLQSLTLAGFNMFNGNTLNFIKQHQELRTLCLMPEITFVDDLTYDNVTSIIESLLQLVVLEFCADNFTADQLILLLSMNKNLKKMRFTFLLPPDFVETLRQAATAEWILTEQLVKSYSVIFEYYEMTFERKYLH